MFSNIPNCAVVLLSQLCGFLGDGRSLETKHSFKILALPVTLN